MNRFALIRDGLALNILHDARTLAQMQAAFPDIGPMLVAATAEAQPGWLWDGAAFSPPPPAPVPQEVTNFQARAALLAAGLFETVNAAVLAQGPTSAAYQAWEYANHLTRNGALVNSMGAALGLTAQQLDELFIAAAQIEA